MKDKNIEEKAKEYAKLACSNFIELYNVLSRDQLIEFAATDYLQGYAAAIADQSNTLNQHKEALRDIIPLAERAMDDIRTLVSERELITKAKQLLTDKE